MIMIFNHLNLKHITPSNECPRTSTGALNGDAATASQPSAIQQCSHISSLLSAVKWYLVQAVLRPEWGEAKRVGSQSEKCSDRRKRGWEGRSKGIERRSEKTQAQKDRLLLHIGTYGNAHCNAPDSV